MIGRLLRNSSAMTGAAVAVAILIAEFIILAKLIPSAGSGRMGAPPTILFQGLLHGLVGGMSAAGIVLIYRSIRIINFAQTAIGGAGFALTYNFVVLTPVPFPIAFVLGLIVAGGVGVLFELVFVRRFFRAPRLVLTLFTIVAATLVGGTARFFIDLLPIFPNPAERTVAELSGNVVLREYLPFRDFSFNLPGSPFPYGFVELFTIVAAVATLVAVGMFLRFTRLGVAIRALAENSERAALLGIGIGFLSSVIWLIAGLLSGVGSIMSGMVAGPSATFGSGVEALGSAIAAAVLGRMRSISIAVIASVGIELARYSIQFQQPDLASLMSVGILLVVVVGLLIHRREAERAGQTVSGTWEATEEIRPVPQEMSRMAPVRTVRWVVLPLILAGAIVFPFVASKGQAYLGSVIAIHAIIGLSLVVLTGWAGQVSLGQFGLAAVGAILAGSLAARADLPFLIAVLLAASGTAVVAVILGIPALRLPGLYLAIATLAFATVAGEVFFDQRFFGWLLPQGQVNRPALPFLNFDDERAMYFLSLAALTASLFAVRNIRTTWFGRVLIGLRDNEANAESAGVSPLRMKLTAFAVAGGLAGFGGALLSFQQRGVSGEGFEAFASINLFVLAVIGGMGSIFGPLIGSLVLNTMNLALAPAPEVAAALAPLFAVVILYLAPGGLISIAAKVRDSALRIIAQRNQLIVPSLFADVDPEALHLRLVPIASPESANGGIVSLRRRYDLSSIYSDAREGRAAVRDAAALSAAARSVERDEEAEEVEEVTT